MDKSFLFVFFLFFTSFSIAFADDTAFGGTGSSPMPISKNEIKMVDETVNIIGKAIDRQDMKGEWKISCDFTFENMTDKTIATSVGMPFPVYESDENVTMPLGKNIQLGSPLVYDFLVTIDGKKIPATLTKISPNAEKELNYKHAYIWKMKFAPHQTVKIHNEYVIGVTTNVLGQIIVSYVLKTGGLWQAGTIGSAKIKIIPNTKTRLCNELAKNPADYLNPKPSGIEAVGTSSGRKYVWDLKNFQPKEDLEVCLETGKNYVRYHVVFPLINNTDDKPDLNALSKQELRILRNSIYAQYGKHFESTDLQAYFDKQWWYQQNQAYSENMLTTEDHQALKLIEKAEGK